MMYGRKNVCLDPFYPLAKFEQNRKTFLPRPGTARPGTARHGPARPSRFWDAYFSETVCFIKKKIQTKNDHLLHKFNVLKLDVDLFIDIKGRPLFVRVTLFWFFYYIFWSIENFENPKIGFERFLQYLSDGIYLNF